MIRSMCSDIKFVKETNREGGRHLRGQMQFYMGCLEKATLKDFIIDFYYSQGGVGHLENREFRALRHRLPKEPSVAEAE